MKESNQGIIPDALRNFDQLPDPVNVRQHVVQTQFACSAVSFLRAVHAGRIPKLRKLSLRTTCWNVGELRATLIAAGK